MCQIEWRSTSESGSVRLGSVPFVSLADAEGLEAGVVELPGLGVILWQSDLP